MASRPAKDPSSSTSGKSKPKVRACAECRRLKLRCDRIFPCQACVRRGCGALCPDKCFTDEATPSSLKANSLRSKEELRKLQERLSLVEAALASVQPNHPLILPPGTDKPTPSTDKSTQGSTNPSPQLTDSQLGLEEAIDIFGTLSIGDDGTPVFHGATSLAENFMQTQTPGTVDRHQSLTNEEPALPSNIQLLSVLFPFAPRSVADSTDISELLVYVPPVEIANQLSEIYWYHLSIGCSPVSHHQYNKYIHHFIYPDGKQPRLPSLYDRKKAHCLSLFYMIMALGNLTDLRFPVISADAERYHQLARACLSIHPVCDYPSIPGLGAMLCMSWYYRSTPMRTTAGYRWAFNGILLKLANALGIFRDGRRWLSSEDEIEQRELLAWELICQEIWTSFLAGRACSIDLTLIDCAKPDAAASIHADMSDFIRGFTQWKHKFYPLINDVLLVSHRPGPVKYSEILKLEKELRFCSMPEELESCVISPYQASFSSKDLTKHIQGMTALIVRESACAMLHRRFLVLAMQNPGDPRDGPFWYSAFQASFGAAWVIKAHVALYQRHPGLISRVPSFWSMAFSSACILGAVAGRYGNQEFARATMAPFQAICGLFAETAETTIQPPNALEVLERLWRRVREHIAPTGETNVPTFNDLSLLGAQPALARPSASGSLTSTAPSFSKATHIRTTPEHAPLPSGNPYPPQNPPADPAITPAPVIHEPYPTAPPPRGMTARPSGFTRHTPSPPTMHAIEQLWYAPELSLLPDQGTFGANGQYGQPMYTPVDQTYQPYAYASATAGSSPEGVSIAPYGEHYPGGGGGGVPSPSGSGSGTEVAQWDQFLDRVGVWDPNQLGVPQ